jgi:hypothetical protein
MKNLWKEADKIKFRIDKRLNNLDHSKMAPEKLAAANEALKHIKVPINPNKKAAE